MPYNKTSFIRYPWKQTQHHCMQTSGSVPVGWQIRHRESSSSADVAARSDSPDPTVTLSSGKAAKLGAAGKSVPTPESCETCVSPRKRARLNPSGCGLLRSATAPGGNRASSTVPCETSARHGSSAEGFKSRILSVTSPDAQCPFGPLGCG